jgi:hypothetical protein
MVDVIQRREAERVPPPEPLPGKVGDVPMQVVEIARLGCRMLHEPRLPVGSKWNVSFVWGSDELRFHAELVWSSLLLTGGKKSYESGLRFSDADTEELARLKRILASYLSATLKDTVPDRETDAEPVSPFLATPFFGDPDALLPGEGYREYRLLGDKWQEREIDVPLQPRDGFCLSATAATDDVDGYKKSYLAADDATRRMIRASLEIQVT